jgi:hypothetical protein
MYLELESRCSKVEVAKEKVEREKKTKQELVYNFHIREKLS